MNQYYYKVYEAPVRIMMSKYRKIDDKAVCLRFCVTQNVGRMFEFIY